MGGLMKKLNYEQDITEREIIAKLWGWEEVLVSTELYTSKILWISPGYQCSLHYHDVKDETFIAVDGLTRVEYYLPDGTRVDTVLVGWRRDVLRVPPGTPHRFWSMEACGSALLEVSTKHSDTDVTRLEESRAFDETITGEVRP